MNKLIEKGIDLRGEIIKRTNYDAFLVGGCVRDYFSNRECNDVDIATNCPMEVLKQLFKTTAVGEQFGTLIVHYKGEQFEVTQFRSEKYSGTRKPETTFGKTIEEDLARRDFTMNAMAWDGVNVIDPFGGLQDLNKEHTIKFVGDVEKRIKEDPLRILRYFRFMAKYQLRGIQSELFVILKNTHLLETLSAERIRDELNKGIMLKNSGVYFDKLHVWGVLEKVIPELDKAFEFTAPNTKDLKEHMLQCMSEGATDNLKVRWAALLHDIGKPLTYENKGRKVSFTNHNTVGAKIVKKVMVRLKFSNDITHFVVNATDRHMGTFEDFTDRGVKKLYETFGKDLPLFLEVKMADYIGHQNKNMYKFKYKMVQMSKLYTKVIDYMHRVIENEQAFKITDLAVSGNTLIALGFSPGPQFGTILNDLLDKVIDKQLKNTEKNLVEYIEKNYKEKIK